MSKFVELANGAVVINVDRVLRAEVNPDLYGPDDLPMVQLYCTTNPREEPLAVTWSEWNCVLRPAMGLNHDTYYNTKQRR